METEVVNYIKEAQKHGLSDIEIKQNLLNAGWDAAVVEQSIVHVKSSENRPPEGGSSSPAPSDAQAQKRSNPVSSADSSAASKAGTSAQTGPQISSQQTSAFIPAKPAGKALKIWLPLGLIVLIL